MYVSLPHPRAVELFDGTLPFESLTLIYLPPDAEALDIESARLLQQELTCRCGRELPISRAWRPPQCNGIIALGTRESLASSFPAVPAHEAGDEAYGVLINEHGILLCAATSRGRLWATQTVRQLIRQYREALPCLRVDDAPSMRYRGVMLDIARRKVPTVETLTRLVDTLSLFKINMLQLQVEHTFQWRRHPRIGEGCGSLSCEDILTLDAHCRRRGIELVPMLQSFGHMRNILMLDEYRHLAEHEHLQWSLNPTDPASMQLLDELFEEYLPCFSSNLVNVGSDETFDLGLRGGKSNEEIERIGKGRVYVNHLLRLHRLLTDKYGKQMMCWGDVVLSHPDLISELPDDLILLNWWYNPDPEFPSVHKFAEHQQMQIICPGTNSWGQIFPRVTWAWINVENFVRGGKSAGAMGMLNTDWGDHGHFNLLGCSYYSYAHGAVASWMDAAMPRERFDALLGPILFGGMHGSESVALIHQLGDGDPEGVWDMGGMTSAMLFKSPFEGDERFAGLRDAPLAESADLDEEAAFIFHDAACDSYEPEALADLAWAAEALAFGKRKTAWMQQVEDIAHGRGDLDALLREADRLLTEFPIILENFCTRWHAGNRHSEIDISLAQFEHGALGLRLVRDWLHKHDEALRNGESLPLPLVPKYQPVWKENMEALWEAHKAEEAENES